MEIDVTNDRKNPLLGRRDLELFIAHDGITPSKNELEKAIASKLKAKETHLVVTHVYQGTGRLDAKVIAKIYDKPIKEEKKEEAPKTEEPKKEDATPAAVEKKEETTEEAKSKEETTVDEAKKDVVEDAKKEEPATKEPKSKEE